MLDSWIFDSFNAAFTGMAFSFTTAPVTTLSVSCLTAKHKTPVSFFLQKGYDVLTHQTFCSQLSNGFNASHFAINFHDELNH